MKSYITKSIKITREEGFGNFLYYSLKYSISKILYFGFFDKICFNLSKKKLTELMRKENTINDIVNTPFNYSGYGRYLSIKPYQIKSEIESALNEIFLKRPKVILEIGTAKGGSLYMLSRIASDDAIIISLDLPNGEFGGGYTVQRSEFYRQFTSKDQSVHFIMNDSHSKLALEAVEHLIGNKGIDLLFIDGDHTYQGAKLDYDRFSKLVNKGGLTVLHDIATHHNHSNCDVDRLWSEIESINNTKSFIEDPNQGWAGIGIRYH